MRGLPHEVVLMSADGVAIGSVGARIRPEGLGGESVFIRMVKLFLL
jgi:hypothetical protein